MIYDPTRRALELKQRILESMTPAELNDYLEQTAVHFQNGKKKTEDAPPRTEARVERASRLDSRYSHRRPGGVA